MKQRHSLLQVFRGKVGLKFFQKLKGKRMKWSYFSTEFIEKKALSQVLTCKLNKVSYKRFLQNLSGHCF